MARSIGKTSAYDQPHHVRSEARGLLDDDAPIVATSPTLDLAKLLLEDSLKIHRLETTDRDQQFTERDVEVTFERFEPVNYSGGLVAGVADVPTHESLVFRLGNAAHLFGSAWLSLQTSGYKVVFSGDLGGRAAHLPRSKHRRRRICCSVSRPMERLIAIGR